MGLTIIRATIDAIRAGNNTVFLKVHPELSADGKQIDFTTTDKDVELAKAKGLYVVMAILGWVGLGDGRFWDMKADGIKVPNQLDPFWPEAMKQYEWYHTEVIKHYCKDQKIIAFAPTWGIYGEAGFTSFDAGRSDHALARFNESRVKNKLIPLTKLPTRDQSLNTDYNLFIRFRYCYLEELFSALIGRLKHIANRKAVGTWQELYPVVGYLWTMVEVPSADFSLYESCFPVQTNHHPEKTIAETMGFRYRCRSWREYRDYYLPLCARKRGEGQQFIACQLTNDYASNYGWDLDTARKMQFDRWEDYFTPTLKRLNQVEIEDVYRDVLLVFPSYSAAALSDAPSHFADAAFIDVMLRMYGCQMDRYAIPRLDKMSVADMNKYKLIIVPSSAYILSDTYRKLKKSTATLVFTGQFAKALDGELSADSRSRKLDRMTIEYVDRKEGVVSINDPKHEITRYSKDTHVTLHGDESFRIRKGSTVPRTLLSCSGMPILSVEARFIFLHGDVFAASCYNAHRIPPEQAGSSDVSANEVDMWGPYDSIHKGNEMGYALIKGILNYAHVDYRVENPKPRTMVRYLGDHMEQASISANIAYNNTGEVQRLTVMTPYHPVGYNSLRIGSKYQTTIEIAPYSYIALRIPK